MNLFDIEVQKRAELLDFSVLPEAEKKVLCKRISFNKEEHEICGFSILFRFFPKKSGSKRKIKRKDFSKADYLFARIKIPSDGITLLGIYPPSTDEEGNQIDIGLEVEVGAKSPIGGISGKGSVKKSIKKAKNMITAQHIEKHAEWIFQKSFLTSKNMIVFELFYRISKNLEPTKRFFYFSVALYEGKREIKGAYNRKIAF